jgi:YHS domain-containing protein
MIEGVEMETKTVKDPVCGMEIDPQDAVAVREVNGQALYFCSKTASGSSMPDRRSTTPWKN